MENENYKAQNDPMRKDEIITIKMTRGELDDIILKYEEKCFVLLEERKDGELVNRFRINGFGRMETMGIFNEPNSYMIENGIANRFNELRYLFGDFPQKF